MEGSPARAETMRHNERKQKTIKTGYDRRQEDGRLKALSELGHAGFLKALEQILLAWSRQEGSRREPVIRF